jgi:hypothetical protein
MGRRGAHTVNDFKRSTCTTTGCPGKGVTNGLTAPSWNLNYNARAYVICQNVNDSVTDAMIDSLAKAIVTDYRAGFITYAAAHNIHGHRCVSSKSCPATPMWNKMWALHTKIHYYIDKGLGGTAPAPSDDDDSGGGTVGIGYDVWSYKGTNITRDAYSYLRGIASDAAASEAAAKANAVTLASIKTALAAQTTTVAALKAVVEQLVAAGPGGTVTAEEIGQIVDTRVQAVIAELDQAEQERAAILASLNTVRAGASAEEVVTELRRQFGLPAEPLPLDTTTPS